MASTSRRMMLFQLTVSDRGETFLREEPTKVSDLAGVLDPRDGFDVSSKTIEQIVTYLDIVSTRKKPSVDLKLVEVCIETTTIDVDVDSPEFISERRRRALAKLSDLDVQALEVERFAVFNKVKFHGDASE